MGFHTPVHVAGTDNSNADRIWWRHLSSHLEKGIEKGPITSTKLMTKEKKGPRLGVAFSTWFGTIATVVFQLRFLVPHGVILLGGEKRNDNFSGCGKSSGAQVAQVAVKMAVISPQPKSLNLIFVFHFPFFHTFLFSNSKNWILRLFQIDL